MDPLLIAILCFLLAGILAAADLMIPSGGVLAISSLLAAIASIFFAFRSSPTAGMLMLILLLIAIPIFLVAAIRVWPYTPVGRRIILKAPQEESTAVDPAAAQLQEMLGSIGVTQNSLMPCGYVRIDHRNYNAVTENGVIEAGQNVEVIGVQQKNLVVVLTSAGPRGAELPKLDPQQPGLGESLLDVPAEELGLDSIE